MTDSPKPPSLGRKLRFAAKLAIVFAVSTTPMLSESQRAAITRVLHDPLAVLAGRSPGARGDGPLIQTKPARDAALPEGDHLLSAAYVFPPGTLSGPAESLLGAAPPPEALPEGGSGGGNLAGAGSLASGKAHPAGIGSPLGGTFVGGQSASFAQAGRLGRKSGGNEGGGGGGGVPGGRDPQSRPAGSGEKPVIPVPEPASWAMLLTGFFLLGGMMRRRAARGHAAASH